EVHAVVPHGNTIGYRNSAELQRGAAGRTYTGSGGFSQSVEWKVARCDFIPGRCVTYLRLIPILLAHANRTQHSTGRSPFVAISYIARTRLHVNFGVFRRHSQILLISCSTKLHVTVRG